VEYQDRIPLSKMCSALRYPRASYYRLITGKERMALTMRAGRPRRSVRKLSAVEEAAILQLLNSPRFCDMAPAEAFTTLLDEGCYHRFESDPRQQPEWYLQKVAGLDISRIRHSGFCCI